MRSRIQRCKRGRVLGVLFLLPLVWSITLGWGIAIALAAVPKAIAIEVPTQSNIIAQAASEETGTVDPVAPRYQLGKELYLENCATCHIPLPPEVLPSETWRRLLLEPQQHYGQQLEPLAGPSLLVVWDYLRAYSRPEKQGKPLPYRISESFYFKALHPRVKFSQPVKFGSCATCHPGAAQYNYRRLTPEWENSP